MPSATPRRAYRGAPPPGAARNEGRTAPADERDAPELVGAGHESVWDSGGRAFRRYFKSLHALAGICYYVMK